MSSVDLFYLGLVLAAFFGFAWRSPITPTADSALADASF